MIRPGFQFFLDHPNSHVSALMSCALFGFFWFAVGVGYGLWLNITWPRRMLHWATRVTDAYFYGEWLRQEAANRRRGLPPGGPDQAARESRGTLGGPPLAGSEGAGPLAAVGLDGRGSE